MEYRGLTRQRVSADSDCLGAIGTSITAATPRRWAPQVSVEYDRGDMVDFSANQVRAGERIKFRATLRPLARLELLPTWSLAQLQAPQGSTTYRESAAQLLAIWHLAPQQTLRLIVQRSQVDRQSEPLRGVAAYVDRGRSDSLTYTWRRSAGTTYYLGANRGRDGVAPDNSRSTEVFAKMQVDVDEWLAR
ncbi:MAG: hypothetical protein IPF55_11580 [Rhodoferax sp.]|nr:hypothetical protein [Rhodoferax sp.]